MAETYRKTRVEELAALHPGLEDYVRLQMQHAVGLAEIAAGVKEKFGEAIAVSTLHSYWQRRFAPDLEQQKSAYRNARAKADLLLELSANGDRDASEIVKLMVRSEILNKAEELAGADAVDLVKLDLRRQEGEGRMEIERGKLAQAERELQLKRDELELEKQKLEAQIAREHRDLEEATHEAEQKIGSGESLTAADIARIRERVYGIAPSPAG